MRTYVADTHALFWYLTASSKLGDAARNAMREAERSEATILVPTIVLAELCYLHQKAGTPRQFRHMCEAFFNAGQFQFVPLEAMDVVEFEIDIAVQEMHDRIVVGVARRSGATLLTRDVAIVESGVVETAW